MCLEEKKSKSNLVGLLRSKADYGGGKDSFREVIKQNIEKARQISTNLDYFLSIK